MKRTLIAMAVILLAAAAQAAPVTTADLLRQESSLEWLGRAMPAGTRLLQFSSYDRRTKIINGQQVEWWANTDTGQYLRSEKTSRGREWVMAEAQGPGAMVRMWSANPGGWHWRVYVDGELVIDEPGADLLSGKVAPWGTTFAHRVNKGANFYFPILFAKSLRVAVASETLPIMYYQVQARLFAAGTEVQPFRRADLPGLAAEIAAADQALLSPARPTGKSERAEVELAAGAAGDLFQLSGPAAIHLLELQVTGDRELPDLLGRVLLRMDWDGERGVAVPLGDFFGTSPGASQMRSLPFDVTPGPHGVTLTCRLVMPFQKEARISLVNQSGARLSLTAEAVTRPWSWDADSLYLRAAWREKDRIPTRPYTDMRMLSAQGRGHFVGLEMNVRNPLEAYWWGEGDEKVWVDGEKFPSIFGTGTEDYFGYAWCIQWKKFTLPYHGISLPTPTNLAIRQAMPYFPWGLIANRTAQRDVVSQYRFQVLDAIPFEQKLDFDMEIMHHRETQVDVNATVYWYSTPGATDDAAVPDLSRREVWQP